MIRLIGARWKYGNVWSWSVLIDPLAFYDAMRQTVLVFLIAPSTKYIRYLDCSFPSEKRQYADEWSHSRCISTSYWCLSHGRMKNIYSAGCSYPWANDIQFSDKFQLNYIYSWCSIDVETPSSPKQVSFPNFESGMTGFWRPSHQTTLTTHHRIHQGHRYWVLGCRKWFMKKTLQYHQLPISNP